MDTFVKVTETIDGKEIGRARLFLISNKLHDKPYGLIEDVFVDEEHRKKGIGKKLVKQLLLYANHLDCYKVIATSRFKRNGVHMFYKELGFKKHGYEFRWDR